MMDAPTQVRGILFRMVRGAFPYLETIVGPELGRYFQKVDDDGWFNGAPYLEARRYLSKHMSADVMVGIGKQLAEVFKDYLAARHVRTPSTFVERIPELYAEVARGPGAGAWEVETSGPGRAVIRENGITGSTGLGAGALKGCLETVGAYNVRVTIVDDAARGASHNRYLVEWLEGEGEK